MGSFLFTMLCLCEGNLVGYYGTYLCTYYELFEYLGLNYTILCRLHITDLKISEKPYKIFEVDNLTKFLNGKTEMEHVTPAKNLS